MSQWWWLATRVDHEEWLDQGLGPLEGVAQSLGDLNRINRWLGGIRSLASHLCPRLRRWRTAPIWLLDLGAGGCAIPTAIVQWARAESIPLRVIALDIQSRHLRLAQEWTHAWPEISLVQGDARRPPFREGRVDVVISSLFLHHFPEAELTTLLPSWVGVARGSIVMTDVVRHPLPYYFIKVASPMFARSRLTRHDAAVSIRRAYTPQELQAIVQAAGVPRAQIVTHFPYRMTLVIDKAEASQG